MRIYNELEDNIMEDNIMEDNIMEDNIMEKVGRVTVFNWGPILDPDQTCRVQAAAESLVLEESTISYHLISPNKKARVTRTAFFNNKEHKDILELGMEVCRRANKEFYGFHIDHIGAGQLAVYEGNSGSHYNWHYDTSWDSPSMYDRKITAILVLSDPSEYTGGSLEFEDGQVYTNIAKGSLITFPSYIRHKVTPVTKGIRVAIVFWAEGPRFK